MKRAHAPASDDAPAKKQRVPDPTAKKRLAAVDNDEPPFKKQRPKPYRRGWYRRAVPGSCLTPAEKKVKLREQAARDKQTPEECLRLLNEEIRDLEMEIKKHAAKFETVRAEMLSGIVSHDGVSAKQVTDQLIEMLSKLKKEHSDVLARVDRAAIDRIISDGSAPVTARGDDNRCVGGCDPINISVDSVGRVDVCTKCHTTYDRRLDDTVAGLPYGDMHPGENSGRIGGYKPPNHFAEIVAQFQGKRRAAAPQPVVDRIGAMCTRYHIMKYKITPDVCRLFLKQMQQEQAAQRKFNRKTAPEKMKKFTDYYKHCPEIAYRLSGIPPPYMTPMQENRVFALFPMVVAGYKTSPRFLSRKKEKKNRKTRDDPNNMNYYYVYYKECQTLGYDEFLPYIPLPKSLANIDDNDQNGWKHCCVKYGWAYTPTR